MRYGSLKAKRKTVPPDRKFIIAIVAVTSALSFTLGYFVGGAGDKGKQPEYQIIAAPKLEAVPQAQEQVAPLNESQNVTPVRDLSLSGADASKPQMSEEKPPPQNPCLFSLLFKKSLPNPRLKLITLIRMI